MSKNKIWFANFLLSILHLSLIFLLSVVSLSGQSNKAKIQEAEGGKYLYNNKIKKLHEFGDEFQSKGEVYDSYLAFNKYRKKAKRLGVTSLISITATAALIYRSNSGEYFEGGYLGLALVTGITSIFSGLYGINAKTQEAKHKSRLLDGINTTSLSLDTHKIQSRKDLIINPLGVKFSYSF